VLTWRGLPPDGLPPPPCVWTSLERPERSGSAPCRSRLLSPTWFPPFPAWWWGLSWLSLWLKSTWRCRGNVPQNGPQLRHGWLLQNSPSRGAANVGQLATLTERVRGGGIVCSERPHSFHQLWKRECCSRDPFLPILSSSYVMTAARANSVWRPR
jgi:hypothetical protein